MSLYSLSKVASLTVDRVEAQYDDIHLPRTPDSIYLHTMSEMGELAIELAIAGSYSYKDKGKDGIAGEAIDAIMCLLDIIHKANPELCEDDLNAIMEAKTQKWIHKVLQRRID